MVKIKLFPYANVEADFNLWTSEHQLAQIQNMQFLECGDLVVFYVLPAEKPILQIAKPKLELVH
jgi:hypothetical protein